MNVVDPPIRALGAATIFLRLVPLAILVPAMTRGWAGTIVSTGKSPSGTTAESSASASTPGYAATANAAATPTA